MMNDDDNDDDNGGGTYIDNKYTARYYILSCSKLAINNQ